MRSPGEKLAGEKPAHAASTPAPAPAHAAAAPAFIEVAHLTHDYGRGRGVFDVTFAVEPGQTLGFLGPNGAGKTVTMRHLMGFVRPQQGAVRIAGLDCFARRADVQRLVGYLPGELACPDSMTGEAFLRFMVDVRQLGERGRRRVRELADYFELDPSAKLRRMSKGTRQKVGLISAFMGDPQVLLLDEPTSGLDPLMQDRFVRLVQQAKERGATVLLSSHIFDEVERVCDRVAFIRAGRVAAVRSMDEVRSSRQRDYLVEFADADQRDRFVAQLASREQACGAATVGATAGEAAVETAADVEPLGATGARIVCRGGVGGLIRDLAAYDVVDLRTREQTLEETFMHIYEGRDGRDACDGCDGRDGREACEGGDAR